MVFRRHVVCVAPKRVSAIVARVREKTTSLAQQLRVRRVPALPSAGSL